MSLSKQERENIKQLHRKTAKRRFADKFKAILLLDDGFSCVEVGKILLLDDDTIRKYREQYVSFGAEGLLKDNYKGTSCYLDTQQLELLNMHLEETTYSKSKGIIDWIKKEFGLCYSSSGIVSLLDRMGFVYKKPIPTPCKVDVKKQEKFIDEYNELKENLKGEDQIYFVDGVHPQHNTIAAYGWIKKGKKNQRHLKTNNGRQRININGALNLKTKEVIFVEDDRINAQTMIALLLLILKGQKEGKIHIILDNAKYYHAQIVKDFLKEHPRIELHFMPAYSPNLNIIERLWKILKENVVYNKFHLKFDDFKIAVNDFFKNKIWMKEEYSKILTDNFQIIDPDFSGCYVR